MSKNHRHYVYDERIYTNKYLICVCINSSKLNISHCITSRMIDWLGNKSPFFPTWSSDWYIYILITQQASVSPSHYVFSLLNQCSLDDFEYSLYIWHDHTLIPRSILTLLSWHQSLLFAFIDFDHQPNKPIFLLQSLTFLLYNICEQFI